MSRNPQVRMNKNQNRSTVVITAALALVVVALVVAAGVGIGLLSSPRSSSSAPTPSHVSTSRTAAAAMPAEEVTVTVTHGSARATTATTPVGRATGTATALPVSLAQVSRTDPNAVAAAALKIMYTTDTTVDYSWNDALRRSRPLLSTRYAALVSTAAPTGPVGAQWNTWTRHRARTSALVTRAGEETPPATSTQHYGVFTVNVTVSGTGGYHATESHVVYCTLTRAGRIWSLDEIDLR